MPDQTSPGNGQLDLQAVQLAQAIRQQESGGHPDAVNKLTGARGAYQYMPETWKAAAKAAGVTTPLENASLDEQNKVAYTQIKGWKDQGMDPGQIASQWYTGKPDQGGNVTPQKGGNPSPADYTKSVYAHYLAIKGGTQTAQAGSPAALQASQASQGGTQTAQANSGVGFTPASVPEMPNPAPYTPSTQEPDAPTVPPVLAPTGAAPSGPSAPASGINDQTYDAAAREATNNSPGGPLGFAQNAVKGAASMVPGAPYLEAAASYLPISGVPKGTPFSQRVALYRGLNAGTNAAAPIATTVGGGAIMAPVLAATIPEMGTAGLIRTAVQGAKVGAVMASPTAALNAATGQTSPVDAVGDVALQAGLGALGAGISKPALQGAAAILRNIFPKFQNGTLPSAALQAFAGRLGVTADQLQTSLGAMKAAGVAPSAIGAASEANLGKFAQLLSRNPETAVMARNAVADAEQDVRNSAGPILKGVKSPQDYVNDRETQATSDYAAARATTVPLNADEADLLRGLREENGITLPKPLQKEIQDQLGPNGPASISGATYDSIRQQLSGMASKPGAPQIVRDAADALHTIGNGSPEIAQANANYKIGSRRIDAANLGKDIFNSNEPVAEFQGRLSDPKQFDPTTPGAGTALRSSINQQIGTKLQSAPAQTINRLSRDQVLQGKLKAVLGDTATKTMTDNATAQAQNDARLTALAPALASKELDDGDQSFMHAAQGLIQATDLSPYSIYHFARALSTKVRGFGPEAQKQIGTLMFSTDPADHAKAVSAAKAVDMYRRMTSTIATRMSAVLGSTGTQYLQGTSQ